jgi:hypothetical protein
VKMLSIGVVTVFNQQCPRSHASNVNESNWRLESDELQMMPWNFWIVRNF